MKGTTRRHARKESTTGGTKTRKRLSNTKPNKSTKPRMGKGSSLKCAPKSSTNSFSCYSNANLFELKRAWNGANGGNKIATNAPKEIWSFLHDQYSDRCGNESCWLKDANIPEKFKRKMIKTAFAPRAPKSWKDAPNTWLSSTDIMNVMEQYERAYPKFRFVGPSPIDFDKKLAFDQCVWNDLCNMDVAQLIQNNTEVVGMIFNLDPHNKDGSHWVSMYFNVPRGELYYFDSVGEKIPKQIDRLRKNIVSQARKLGRKIKFDQLYPKVEHQMQYTECGMYSLYFIVMMLDGTKTWPDFKTTKKRITDEEMAEFRDVFFNKE